ncbi:MAG: SDR family oxidoreductase [Phycisphaerales bacterium]|nr:SDR family oxidoreductase [Phycisphaerales bacterium]
MQLHDNTILITGGGSGIGRGLADAFHALGNTVVIAGRSQRTLDEATAANPDLHAMTLDVTEPADVHRFAHEVAERFPALNVLINNAGVMRIEDVTRHDLAGVEAIIATNLLGPIRLTAALIPHLAQQPRATVMNVTSGLAFVPLAATPTYNATKAALHSYTLSLREQLRDTSVEVIELVPPYVQTRLTGEHQATDPRAMPLDAYIADTMAILHDHPDAKEVIIERVAPLRHAEVHGTFDEMFGHLSAMGREFSANP